MLGVGKSGLFVEFKGRLYFLELESPVGRGCALDITGSIVGSVTGLASGIASISNNGPYTLFPPPPSDVFSTPALKVKQPLKLDQTASVSEPSMEPSPSSMDRRKKEAELATTIDDLYMVGWGGGGASFKRRASKKL